eukprot:3460891-Amphidinium_carterae.1
MSVMGNGSSKLYEFARLKVAKVIIYVANVSHVEKVLHNIDTQSAINPARFSFFRKLVGSKMSVMLNVCCGTYCFNDRPHICSLYHASNY